jgi:hypothetical protein
MRLIYLLNLPPVSARIMPERLEGVKAQQQGASLTEPRHRHLPAHGPS